MNAMPTETLTAPAATEVAQAPEAAYSLTSYLLSNNEGLRLRIEVPNVGSAKTHFVRRNHIGINGEIVVSSGHIDAEPQGKGLGSRLLTSISRVLQALAHESGRTIVHPISATSERSRRLFARHGHQPFVGKNQSWVTADSRDVWNIRLYNPDDATPALTPQESLLFEQFKVLEPKVFDRY